MDLARYNFTLLGHGSVVRTTNGDDWFVYHAYRWKQIEKGPGRVLCLDKVHWNKSTKWPFIGTPSDKSTLAPNVDSDSYKIFP